MNRTLRIFLAGVLAILPVVVTIVVTLWFVTFATEYIGPDSKFGQLLTGIGLGVSATTVAPYVVGLCIILAFVYLLGLLVETRIGPWISGLMDSIFRRIPVLSTVYDLSKRAVAIVDTKGGGDNIKSMSAVWCFFGGEPGAAVLGLMPQSKPILIGSESYLGVIIPTAPVPIGGCLVYVPAAWIKPAEGGVEHLMSVYVSMGVTPPIVTPAALSKPT